METESEVNGDGAEEVSINMYELNRDSSINSFPKAGIEPCRGSKVNWLEYP